MLRNLYIYYLDGGRTLLRMKLLINCRNSETLLLISKYTQKYITSIKNSKSLIMKLELAHITKIKHHKLIPQIKKVKLK